MRVRPLFGPFVDPNSSGFSAAQLLWVILKDVLTIFSATNESRQVRQTPITKLKALSYVITHNKATKRRSFSQFLAFVIKLGNVE